MQNELYRDHLMPILTADGFKNVCYREWGDKENDNVVICVHGLSRNRFDFDTLGSALSLTHRVLAIDMPGRGDSDWLTNKEEYRYPAPANEAYPIFHNVLMGLISRTGVETIDWIGTSMGGILGIELAAKKNLLSNVWYSTI